MINKTFSETGESIFSTITRLSREFDAINLGQGFPNFFPPESLRDCLSERRSSEPSDHQYAPSPGHMELRRQIAGLYRDEYNLNYDPELEITVTSGATEALSSALYGLLNEGDEVILFEPVYDLYAPVARRAGADVTLIPLQEPGFEIPVKRLKREASEQTQLIIVNNPHNPTGRVFSKTELREIVHVAEAHEAKIISDEVYEQLTYDGNEHIPMATVDGARERTLTMGSVGKLFNATGWKIGWALGPEPLTRSIRSAHQFATFCAATPLQLAVAEFMESEDISAVLTKNRDEYEQRREILVNALDDSFFDVVEPDGTYFSIARIPDDRLPDGATPDLEFVKHLIREQNIAAIPLTSFYVSNVPEEHYLRFAFCKERSLLEEAGDKLRSLE